MAVAFDTPLYNSRIFDSYLKLLNKRYPQVNITELLDHAGMRLHEIADPGHWFSQRQVDLFHEKLVHLTGDYTIARQAGRYAASPDALGHLRAFLLGLMGPEYIFVIINKIIASNFSRSSNCTCRRVGRRQLELTVTFQEGVQENPRQCENRIGFFEAVFLMFDHEYPQIEHTECVFKGSKVCRYLISWKASFTSRLVLARRVSVILLLAASLVVAWLSSNPYLGPLLLCALLLHLSTSFWFQRVERKSLLTSLDCMRTSSERLLMQVQGNYDNALMINEIGEVISRETKLDLIISRVNEVLQKRLNYGRGMILLADPDRSALRLAGSFGFTPIDQRILEKLEHPLDAGGGRGILMRCFQSQKPLLVNRLADVEQLALPETYAFVEGLGIRSFLAVPVVADGVSLGVLAVNDARREGELMQSDLNLIEGLAKVIGIAISNSMLLENEQKLSEEIKRGAEQLERRVEERTAELTQGHEELELFYDTVSHDLRTPLRVIYGYGELLLDSHSRQLDETARLYIGRMMKGGEQMEATLDRMLRFSEVRLMELKLQPVDLSAMAVRIMLDLRVSDKARAVTADIQEGVTVHGDEKLLQSVMENLIGNAWKYTANRSLGWVSFGMRGGVCYVSDNGDGFDMTLADRLFKPFQRLHDGSTFAGHGLGLALVQRSIERMGGRVWANGKPGEGATFYFTVSGETLP